MPFSEATKLEAKRRAHFSCVVCHQPFVEVHHIIPQAAGGSDDLENAAPLCASCHDLLGGNPDKRKQIREMRDLWYELCETRFRDSPTLKLAEAVEDIKNHQHEQGALLSEIKGLLGVFYNNQSQNVMLASTTSQLSSLSGVTIPPDYIRNRTDEPPKFYSDDFPPDLVRIYHLDQRRNARDCVLRCFQHLSFYSYNYATSYIRSPSTRQVPHLV